MYAILARHYDLLHQSVTDDIPFVLRLAAGVSGPVLELGCGTGRLLRPLAEAGKAVWGLDYSPEMLALAREKAAAWPAEMRHRLTLVEADMADFSLAPRFDLIVVGYNAFLHLARSAMAAALRRSHEHLTPAGRLYLDLENPYGFASLPDEGALALEQLLRLPGGDGWLLHYTHSRVDPAAQIARVTTILDESAAAGGPVRRQIAAADFHYLFPHQCELLLNDAGLRLVGLFGDYDERPFAEDSPRLIVVGAA